MDKDGLISDSEAKDFHPQISSVCVCVSCVCVVWCVGGVCVCVCVGCVCVCVVCGWCV